MHPRTLWIPLLLTSAVSLALAQERSIDKEVVVAAPVAEVWQDWTTKAGIESFFAPEAQIDARVGGAFHIHMDPFGAPDMKGADDMRYMALQPMKMLSFDWNAPPSLPEARQQRTFVVVRLHDIDGKSTRVTIHHTGWGDGGEWGQDLCLFRPRVAQGAGQPQAAPREGPDGLDRVAQAAAGDARRAAGEVSRAPDAGSARHSAAGVGTAATLPVVAAPRLPAVCQGWSSSASDGLFSWRA